MGDSASEKMSASEIQSKLVAAIRQIAELEDKIEACDKKSKELAGEIERRSRQIFYLERNCEQRDKEISEMKTKNFMLEAKANQEDYESKIEEQECQGLCQQQRDYLHVPGRAEQVSTGACGDQGRNYEAAGPIPGTIPRRFHLPYLRT